MFFKNLYDVYDFLNTFVYFHKPSKTFDMNQNLIQNIL